MGMYEDLVVGKITVTTGLTVQSGGTVSGTFAGANLTGAVTSVANATSLGSFTSAQLATALTDETGSGANVFATSPTLVTPLLGTPTSGTLTNCTGLPWAGVTKSATAVTGSKGSNAALTSLIAALVTAGLITDSTT